MFVESVSGLPVHLAFSGPEAASGIGYIYEHEHLLQWTPTSLISFVSPRQRLGHRKPLRDRKAFFVRP